MQFASKCAVFQMLLDKIHFFFFFCECVCSFPFNYRPHGIEIFSDLASLLEVIR